MNIINKETWKRKEYFEFFSKYSDPFFGLVSEVNCTNTYNFAKENKISFFALYLHKSLVAINKIEEFRYRIMGEKIVLFDEVHAATTIGREDESFGFSFIKYSKSFNIFNNSLKKEVHAVQNSTGIRYLKDSSRYDVIHYSTIPWLSFSDIKHPGDNASEDSAPKIIFGKAYERNSKIFLPISVHAHHGFADGIHIAKFLNYFEKLLQGY